MKKKLFASFLAVALVVALAFAVAPAAYASGVDHTFTADNESWDVTGDCVIDLAGFDVTINVTGNPNVVVIDSKNLEVLTGAEAGKLTVNGDCTINEVNLFDDYRYLKVKNEGNTYSFHPFNMSITRTGVNVGAKAICMEAAFIANNVVRDTITEFGVKSVTKDEYYPVTSGYQFGEKNGVYAWYSLMGSLEEDQLNESRTFCAYIKIGDTVIDGLQRIEIIPKNVLGKINEEYAAGNYTGATKELADRLYADNESLQAYLPAMKYVPVKPVQNEVIKVYDLYTLENKESLVIDFAENIVNDGNLALSYSVEHAGEELVLDGTCHTFNFGTYSDAVTYETFEVTVTYTENGEEHCVTYTLKLALLDSTACRLANGGFEDGMDGWTVVGNIGNVSSDKNYWVNDPEKAEGFEFGMDGDKMFSAYVSGAEERAVGTLTSSTFKVGGSGFVTFKIGAMRDGNYVYVDVVDAQTKEILTRYYNGLWADRTNDIKSGCTLIAYKADLSEFAGREVFFRISDNADSGYGLFFADSFVTYYATEPEGFNYATTVDYAVSGTIYDLFNGGFEMGNNLGWWNNGEIGVVTNANGYWGDNIPYNKDGDYLFTGVESNGADTMREGNRGTLTSSVFEIGGTGWISFKLGGGGNELCYVQVIDAVTSEVLARYHQQAQQDAVLIQYVADLSAHIGKTARIQVVDYASEGWGCVSFDSVKTYYASTLDLPGALTANNIFQGVYDVANGSFESGMDGWNMNITEAGAHNTLGWVESSEHDAGWYTKNDGRKDGNNLFTFCKPDGTNCENTKGTLNSSVFTLKRNSYVSFRFGGAGTRDVRIELCRVDGTVIATFYNEAPGKVNTEMYAYYYQYAGETADCFFRVVDNSTSNYGCFVVDDFRANLVSAPEGFIAAIQ
ncbi:MAG: hypothetical protein E7453_01240 [Ruminococcaceae bacterium]|nr:hypothetical protein [Oscillospiraceae bacterium]